MSIRDNFTKEFLEEFEYNNVTCNILTQLDRGVSPYVVIEKLIRLRSENIKSFNEAMVKVRLPYVNYSEDVLKWLDSK